MSCRDEILECARKIIAGRGRNEFTITDILDCMRRHGTKYPDSTIRTHIVSRLCANAPDNHAVTYRDLERTDRGTYRLRNVSSPSTTPTDSRSVQSRNVITSPEGSHDETETRQMATLSNTEKGRLFQERSRNALKAVFGCEFELEVSLPIPPRKSHTFDLVNSDRTIVGECKAVTWTATGNIPAAKIAHLREAVQYLHDLEGERIRCLIISKSCHQRHKESLGSYFVRLNAGYLGNVKVFELAETSDELISLHDDSAGLRQSSRSVESNEGFAAPVNVSDLGSLRRWLFKILDLAEGGPSRNEGPAKRVSRLRTEGKLPRNVANMMQTVLGFRDVAEYEGHVLTKAESALVKNAYDAIKEWAKGMGWQIDDNLFVRR
jgi:hypothetical protein